MHGTEIHPQHAACRPSLFLRPPAVPSPTCHCREDALVDLQVVLLKQHQPLRGERLRARTRVTLSSARRSPSTAATEAPDTCARRETVRRRSMGVLDMMLVGMLLDAARLDGWTTRPGSVVRTQALLVRPERTKAHFAGVHATGGGSW